MHKDVIEGHKYRVKTIAQLKKTRGTMTNGTYIEMPGRRSFVQSMHYMCGKRFYAKPDSILRLRGRIACCIDGFIFERWMLIDVTRSVKKVERSQSCTGVPDVKEK